MVTMCACGRHIYSTSNSPWSIYTLDGQGRVIEGICVHGMHFSFQEDNSTKNMSIKRKGGDYRWEL